MQDLFEKWWKDHSCPGRDIVTEIFKQLNNSKDKIFYNIKGINYCITYEEWMADLGYNKLREFIKNIKLKEYNEIKKEYPSETKHDENILLEDISLLKKEIQTLRDSNTRLRRHYRENYREVSKIDEILMELKNHLKDTNFDLKITEFDEKSNKKGIIQFSDLHLNSLVDEQFNKYDFDIASKRLKKYINKAIKFFKDNNIVEIYLFNTGDTISSNRRDSEKLNTSTGRVRASVIAVKLFSYILKELSEHFKINVAFTSANESRIEKDNELDDLSASENFDIIIYEILKSMFSNKGINFIDCDMVEGVINIDGKDVIITHGYPISDAGVQKKIQEIKGKYVSSNKLIYYIFFGDKHSALISDKFSRSASLMGSNGYSCSQLGFDSRASQNLYIMHENGSVDGYKIDLQEADNDGYDISEELIRFKVKRIIK